MAGKLDDNMQHDIPEKVIKYEHFLNETLLGDLERNEQDQTVLLSEINDYRQLRVFLNQLKNQSFGSQSQLKVQTDIGSNFYLQSVINDTKHVLMFCGLGVFLHMTIDEAIAFSVKREKLLEQKLNILLSKSNKIKATIKLVFEGLRELQQLR